MEGKMIIGMKTEQLLNLGMSYVPQGKINFSLLTVEENLDLGGEFLEREVLQERKKEVLKQFPVLEKKRKELAFSLSGGQQQMLALGRALICTPKLLLLDEPSLGLSPKLQQELFHAFLTLKEQGIALLIVEQNAKRAIDIADRTYLLEEGKVVLEGGKEILKDKKIKEVYLGG